MNSFVQNLDLQAKGLWFPVVVGIAALFFILLMPKRNINWRGIYLTFGVIGYVALLLDIIVVGQYFDVFDLGDPSKEGIGDVMTYGVIPSCLAVAFLNYFSPTSKWVYVALFTLASFIFEWTLTQVGYMQLKGWQNWYSIPVFIAVYGVWLPWHFRLMGKIFGETAISPPLAQPSFKLLDTEKDNPDNE